MKLKAWLIFRASNQTLRVVRRAPSLEWDEISWSIELSIPQPWGRLAGAIKIDLPESAPPTVDVQLALAPEAP